MREATRRQPAGPPRPTRRRFGRPPSARATALSLAALASAVLLAGCAGARPGEPGSEQTAAAAPVREVLLQPAGAQGPAPFTASTAQEGPPSTPSAPPAAGVDDPAPPGRALTGATPGLYGGTRSVASCNIEQQVAFLTADQARADAFAESAGIPESNIGGWLRGLTPVLLRTDVRVTSHGFSEGHATAFQSVLQAGTAVLVDQYGTPRVRCACGNPLRAPAAAPGAAHAGRPWAGYRPDRVVAITPTTAVVSSLVIVNNADNTWLERKTGTVGDQDRRPDVLPPCDPAACDVLTAPPPPVPDHPAPQQPTTPRNPVAPPTRPDPVAPPPDDFTAVPAPDTPLPDTPLPDGPLPDPSGPGTPDGGTPVPLPDAPVGPDGPGEHPTPEPPPSFEDLFPVETAPQQPETFEG
ncbi:DUF6777 domain-containing protein [Streptomyces sp. NPDC053431]|uniref:DUF6777 domain-containing protein n=1 Tax=Streptomyces sp. NPDC053431 TaxID=3365703 RepID=UPI0037D8D46F